MKKKVDFTIKGTKLPVIPKGTEYSTVENNKIYGTTELRYERDDLVSFGLHEEGYILADKKDYFGDFFYIFKLSTIERLAEEQGMLYEKETERDWTGVRFVYRNGVSVWELKKQSEAYVIAGIHLPPIIPVDRVVSNFANGTWIEVKEESEIDKRTRMAEKLTENIFSKCDPIYSLRDLLEDACSHERNIRKGCPMFSGVDENERLEQVKQEWSKLREVAAVLHKQLNEK